MQKFTVHKGLVAPMDRENVDTDAIIPKQFLKSIARSGFGPNLFDEWRSGAYATADKIVGRSVDRGRCMGAFSLDAASGCVAGHSWRGDQSLVSSHRDKSYASGSLGERAYDCHGVRKHHRTKRFPDPYQRTVACGQRGAAARNWLWSWILFCKADRL